MSNLLAYLAKNANPIQQEGDQPIASLKEGKVEKFPHLEFPVKTRIGPKYIIEHKPSASIVREFIRSNVEHICDPETEQFRHILEGIPEETKSK